MPDVDRLAVGFARVLRGAGLDVPVGTTILFGEALGAVGVSSRPSVYWAGRATLVSRPEDIELYDRSFAAWWDREFQVSTAPVEEREIVLAFDSGTDDDAPDDDNDEPSDAPTLAVRYSRAEVLRQRDFAHYSPDEFAESRRLMNDLRMAGPMRPLAAVDVRLARGGAVPTCGAPCGAHCAPVANPSRGHTSHRPNGRDGSCCCVT